MHAHSFWAPEQPRATTAFARHEDRLPWRSARPGEPARRKVDSAAVQDGFDLYLQGFIVTDDGHWPFVRQGTERRSQAGAATIGLASFVDAMHAAIAGEHQGEMVNMADQRAEPSRLGLLDLLASLGPDRIVRQVRVVSGGRCAGDGTDRLPDRIVLSHHAARNLNHHLCVSTGYMPPHEILDSPGGVVVRAGRLRRASPSAIPARRPHR